MSALDARISFMALCALAGSACAHSARAGLVGRASTPESASKSDSGTTAVFKHDLARADPRNALPANHGNESIYFDFDSATLRDDSKPVLLDVASKLRSGDRSVRVEGNCDQLGTVEYNLALGDARSRAAREYLVRLGVPASAVATISYGSQRPKFPSLDEVDRQKNRRDDFVLVR